MGTGKMILVRALALGGGFGILLVAGAPLTQSETQKADVPKSDVVTTDMQEPDVRPIDGQKTDPLTTDAQNKLVTLSAIDAVDECMVAEICIDRYLWELYVRTPKIDTIRVPEVITVAVERKGKTTTIAKTIFKPVEEDFAWKDPKAAKVAGMSMPDYVIGGMDQAFKATLYRALRALDDAGYVPGITSAFRDDYRQSIASGQKAADNRSYHGGSLHGGYGHGLAADIVSVRGATRAERFAASVLLWKWIDTNGKDFGIGRPYLDRDPPHVGPIDGKEYADHHPHPGTQQAEAATRQAEAKAKTNPSAALPNEHHLAAHPGAQRAEARTREAETKTKTHPSAALPNEHHLAAHTGAQRAEARTRQAEAKTKTHLSAALRSEHHFAKRGKTARS
jgi:hypothetical protein